MKAGKLWLVAVAALLLPPVAANHAQNSGIVYDHRVGNEWWVEVKVTTDSSTEGVDSVWARAEKGTWQPLTLRSWGNWAASFHIPSGQRVQFQAAMSGSRSHILYEPSCFFTHPGGVEQCDPGATDSFRAEFKNPSGNEWWEQVYVVTNRPLARVTVEIDDVNHDKKIRMSLKSWGAWAVSAHAPAGSVVQFHADDGISRQSSVCFVWPQVTRAPDERCPPSFGGAPLEPYMTRFDHKGGNEWWVEAEVGPVRPVLVRAQDEGGSWVPLSLRESGNWAGSFHVEPGHKVRFRAEFGDGSAYESCWFTHTAGITPEGYQICAHGSG